MIKRQPYPILYVLSGNLGGITSGLVELLIHLNRNQFRPWVALLNKTHAVDLFKRLDISRVCLPSKDRIRFLKTFISRQRIRLVQSCGVASDAALAAFSCGIPHVWYVGGSVEKTFCHPNGYVKVFRGLVEKLSNAIVTPSRTTAREEFPRLPRTKLQVIPWGVTLSPSPSAKTGWLKQSFGIPLSSPLVAMVANFYPAKRHEDFIRAATLIHREMPKVKFLIAGNCAGTPSSSSRAISRHYRSGFIALLKGKGWDRFMTLTSFAREDRHAWFPEFDLLVSPSHEGMSQALLEAGACGTPVIAADVGGNLELIQDKVNGLLFPYGNSKALAQAAIQLLENSSLAQRLGRALKRKVRTLFDAGQQARRFEQLYQTAIQAVKAYPNLSMPRRSDSSTAGRK